MLHNASTSILLERLRKGHYSSHPVRRVYSTIACMRAFSKSRSTWRSGLSVWIIITPMRFSRGSTQKWVP